MSVLAGLASRAESQRQTSDVATSTEEIVYGESTRAVTQQQNALDNLRSRTGILRAAATIVTSFLGGQALREDDGIGGVEWLGIGASSPSQR